MFKIKHSQGSIEQKTFLDTAIKPARIPGVPHFECLREVSPKNHYEYVLSVEFESLNTYEAYHWDPAHEAFVKTYWAGNVKDLLEIDYEAVKK